MHRSGQIHVPLGPGRASVCCFQDHVGWFRVPSVLHLHQRRKSVPARAFQSHLRCIVQPFRLAVLSVGPPLALPCSRPHRAGQLVLEVGPVQNILHRILHVLKSEEAKLRRVAMVVVVVVFIDKQQDKSSWTPSYSQPPEWALDYSSLHQSRLG